jgi:chromosome segregation ATPase
MNPRYYAFIKKAIRGPLPARELAQAPGFNRHTLVCPESALGNWREACVEKDFQLFLDGREADRPAAPRPPATHKEADERATRSLLEKSISANARLEEEVRKLRREYSEQKRSFEERMKRKDGEIHELAEKLKRSAAQVHARTEHPSWETLYKTLKKRADEKLAEASQALAERSEEILRLRAKLQGEGEKRASEAAKASEEAAAREERLSREIKELKSHLEDKDMAVRTLQDNIASLAGKSEELQRIIFEERKDYEEKVSGFCDEIGRLRTDVRFKEQELNQIRADLFEALGKMKEMESMDIIRSREQEELYGAIRTRIKLLSGYFENLESRVRYAFRKA